MHASGDGAESRAREHYDAVLLVSFGGPEGPDDVMPFLEHVTAGRGVPRERLDEVAEHYYHRGGVSPINAQNRALLAAMRAEFAAAGLELPVYWGNRHWTPTIVEALEQMRADGVRNALAFLTSAYSSFSGCRQYLDAIERGRTEVGEGAPRVDRLRQYFNHPGFIEPMVDAVRAAIARLEREAAVPPGRVHLAFVAHSVPEVMQASSGPNGGAYVAQLTEAMALVAGAVGGGFETSLSYCSRSGSPSVPWLEPDVVGHLAHLAESGVAGVVVVPIGFVSDHMEVVHDLDVEAAQAAAELGLPFVRAATVGTDPRFVAMIRELVVERLADDAPPQRRALGTFGPAHDVCPPACCRMPAR
jgi:ferrochelatase